MNMVDIASEALRLPPARREAYIQEQAVMLTGRRVSHETVRAALRDAVRRLSRECPRRVPVSPGSPVEDK